jgi:SAM-dependent methyltransferase
VSEDPGDADAARFAAEALAQGAPTAWFEPLYAAADDGSAVVPWDRAEPNAALVDWLTQRRPARGRAIVVGCGYGSDAEYLAGLGFDTTGFDISRSAIAAARARHPGSAVHYVAADLLDLPVQWRAAFDLVVEIRNVQALPPALHARAAAAVSSLVAPGGTLFVAGAVGDGPADGPPWPLTRGELGGFAVDGVISVRVDVDRASGEPPRWRADFRRPAARTHACTGPA